MTIETILSNYFKNLLTFKLLLPFKLLIQMLRWKMYRTASWWPQKSLQIHTFPHFIKQAFYQLTFLFIFLFSILCISILSTKVKITWVMSLVVPCIASLRTVKFFFLKKNTVIWSWLLLSVHFGSPRCYYFFF